MKAAGSGRAVCFVIVERVCLLLSWPRQENQQVVSARFEVKESFGTVAWRQRSKLVPRASNARCRNRNEYSNRKQCEWWYGRVSMESSKEVCTVK